MTSDPDTKNKVILVDEANNLFDKSLMAIDNEDKWIPEQRESIFQTLNNSYSLLLPRVVRVFPMSEDDLESYSAEGISTILELEFFTRKLHSYVFRSMGYYGSWGEKVEFRHRSDVTYEPKEYHIKTLLPKLPDGFKLQDIKNLLTKEHKCSDTTIRNALDKMVKEGLIEREKKHYNKIK